MLLIPTNFHTIVVLVTATVQHGISVKMLQIMQVWKDLPWNDKVR